MGSNRKCQHPRDTLYNSKTGVFVGAASEEYLHLLQNSIQRDEIELHFATGNIISTLSWETFLYIWISRTCITVDTACSSSLVSIHLACQSLIHGSSDLALASGVNLVLALKDILCLAELERIRQIVIVKLLIEMPMGLYEAKAVV